MGKKGFVGAVKGKNDDIRKLVEGEVPDVPKEVKEELVKKLAEKTIVADFNNAGVGNKPTKVFSDEPISWTATRPKGTKQTYEVYQRNDINWDLKRTAGDKRFIGKTNAEAANAGLSPQLDDGGFATLHHLGQDSRGGLAEASTRYHGVGKYGQDILHSQYGKNVPHPNFPIDRQKFGIDTREYWKWRITNR